MRIQESADGTIRVIELDPTKRYWLIVDHNAIDLSDQARTEIRSALAEKRDFVLVKRSGAKVSVIEPSAAIQDVMSRGDADKEFDVE